MLENDDRSYFLIIGNGRTGSTWLTTLLGEYSEIDSDYELKWEPRYPAAPLHVVIEHSSPTIVRMLDEHIGKEGKVVGSKLILDPYRFLSQNELDSLFSKICDKLKLIYLTRDYFELNMSFMRGAFNLTNTSRQSDTMLYKSLNSLRSDNRDRQDQEVDLSANKTRFIENLIVLLFNDIAISEFISFRDQPFINVDYQDLRDRLYEVANLVIPGDVDSDQFEKLIENPPIKKLKEINVNRETDLYSEMKHLSTSFQSVRDGHRRGEVAMNHVFEFHENSVELVNTELLTALKAVQFYESKFRC